MAMTPGRAPSTHSDQPSPRNLAVEARQPGSHTTSPPPRAFSAPYVFLFGVSKSGLRPAPHTRAAPTPAHMPTPACLAVLMLSITRATN